MSERFGRVLDRLNGESEIRNEWVRLAVSEPDKDVVQLQVPMSYPLLYMQKVQCIHELFDYRKAGLHGGILHLNVAQQGAALRVVEQQDVSPTP